MKRRRPGHSRVVAAALGGFFAGAIAVITVVWGFPNGFRVPPRSEHPPDRAVAIGGGDILLTSEDRAERGVALSETPVADPSPVTPSPVDSSTTTPIIEADPVPELRDRRLEIPVRNAIRAELRDSFTEKRGSSREHEAIDILTPRNTPIVAVEDGTIAKLFESKAGGTTVYQFDPTTRYVYYYAHLERYADGLHEGDHVQRGQVLGFAGTSGNAAKDTPHLHFAIFKLTEKKQWWRGSPIDPYAVLK